MRLLKKFNQYMLENHPLTWHSKFIQLMVAGLLFWLVSFICGYLMVNMDVIKSESLWRYYTRSNFVSFHVIYCLIVFCIWAIFFYKNNAIKSFYPLQRLYLVRLFLQLFIAFSVLISASYPFMAGCNAKLKSILPQETFEKDMAKINLGASFLIEESEKSAYSFKHRPDFKALNYDYIVFDEAKSKWPASYDYYYYPELADEKYISSKLMYRDFISGNDSNITEIDGDKYLFFNAVTKYTNADSCSSITLIKEIHKLELDDLHLYSFRNYQGSDLIEETQVRKIQRWTAENRKDSIARAIAGLVEVYNKYQLSSSLDPALIAAYLEAKEYKNLEGFINNYPSGKTDFQRIYADEYAMIMKYSDSGSPRQVHPLDREIFIKAVENQKYFYYEMDRMNQIRSNYSSATEGISWKEVVSTFYLSLFLAWLFIFFEFANIISLLISIPIGGALAILVGVAMAYINLSVISSNGFDDYNYHRVEQISSAIIFCVCLLILLTMIFGLWRKSFNKKVLNVLVNLSYVIAPFFITILLSVLNAFSGHYVYGKCQTSTYEYSFSFLMEPWFHLLFAFIGIFAMFPLIIKWRAKEE